MVGGGLCRGGQVVALNRDNLIKKVRLIRRLEGDEGINQVMSYGRMAQATYTAKAKALR